MNPQLHRVPFSCRGSWFSFFRKNPGLSGGHPSAPLSLRVIAGVLWERAEILDLDLERDGRSLVWCEELATERLVLREVDGPGLVTIAFQNPDTVRLRAEGVTLRLDSQEGDIAPTGPASWRLKGGSHGWLVLRAAEGVLDKGRFAQRHALWLRGEATPAELIVHRTTAGSSAPEPCGGLTECVDARRAEIEAWRARAIEHSVEFSDLAAREITNLWNLTVAPLGCFRRESTLVSKGTLVGLWSWDHCWHSLGTAGLDADLAWNNFLAPFDHQDTSGALPDVFCANQVYWGNVKPPVHGWMLGILARRHAWFGDEHRARIYEPIARLTRFWLRERDNDGDGLPNYLRATDSGWDNATVFDAGASLATPDLATWLILQQEWLAETAGRLGRPAEAAAWTEGARLLLERLLGRLWTGGRFVARHNATHEEVCSDSLLLRIPLLLGARLPEAARRWCLDGLFDTARYRASSGLRSEPAHSPKFDADGYWRGSVWPVTNFIFFEALRVNGLHAEADSLRRDFLVHLARVGNHENYHGLDGRGLRDAGIAWTSTCALALLRADGRD